MTSLRRCAWMTTWRQKLATPGFFIFLFYRGHSPNSGISKRLPGRCAASDGNLQVFTVLTSIDCWKCSPFWGRTKIQFKEHVHHQQPWVIFPSVILAISLGTNKNDLHAFGRVAFERMNDIYSCTSPFHWFACPCVCSFNVWMVFFQTNSTCYHPTMTL